MSGISTTQRAGEKLRLMTENQGAIPAEVIESTGAELAFDFADDSGVVGAGTSVTHIVAVPGVLATDKVKGFNVPSTPAGSGLSILMSVPAADQIQITYNNGTLGGSTNGPTTYRVFLQRV